MTEHLGERVRRALDAASHALKSYATGTNSATGLAEEVAEFVDDVRRALNCDGPWHETPAPLIFPRALTPELTEALGKPIFITGPMAHAFRDAGAAEIKTRMEDEQAFILHWLATLVLEHGANWKPVAGARLEAVISEAKRRHERTLANSAQSRV